MRIEFLRLGVVALAGLLVSLAAQAQQTSVMLVPAKSISIEALRQFEKDLGHPTAPIAASFEAPSPPIVVSIYGGDTLEALLFRHWGLTRGKHYADLTALTNQLLSDRDNNKTIIDRTASKLDIRPGDKLAMPSVVFGWKKHGPVPVPVANAGIDVASLAFQAFRGPPDVQVHMLDAPKIAALSNVESCPEDQWRPPFNAKAVDQRLKWNEKRPPGNALNNKIIAVIDAGVRGEIATLSPFIAAAPNLDTYKSKGGAFIPGKSGEISDLISLTDNDHGAHIIALTLGGVDRLSAAQGPTPSSWKVLPIVIENVKVSGMGLKSAVIQPEWVAKGVSYAQERNAKIVNMSLEVQDGEFMANALTADGERKQRLYVVAAGNGRLWVDNPSPPPAQIAANDFGYIRNLPWPSRVLPGMMGGPTRPHVISVAAHDQAFNLTDFTGHHFRNVDIAARGVCVRSYSTLAASFGASTVDGITGSSQSAAIVSYAASLVGDALGLDPWSPGDVKARLLASSVYDKAKYEKELSSRGRLRIESAVSVRFDIARYRKNGVVEEAVGDFIDYPNSIKFRDMSLCDGNRIGNMWKAVAYMLSPAAADARLDFVPKSAVPFSAPTYGEETFNWTWETCTPNLGNINKIRFKPVEGDAFDIEFKDLVELIPRHL
jgi:hypothetical protein